MTIPKTKTTAGTNSATVVLCGLIKEIDGLSIRYYFITEIFKSAMSL
jgi:hypothetical protein